MNISNEIGLKTISFKEIVLSPISFYVTLILLIYVLFIYFLVLIVIY